MNPFETGERKVIPAVLVYARNRGRTLMLHRSTRDLTTDYHSGKWNGLGGKSEPNESPLETARREFHEESGLALPDSAFHFIGLLHFPNFKSHRSEDWMVTIWVAHIDDKNADHLPGPCSEGVRHWVPDGEVLSLRLWAGDHHFLPLVLAEQPFLGTLWYDGEIVKRHWIHPIGESSIGEPSR